MSIFDFVVNQGYSMVTFEGTNKTNRNMGPIEAAEELRAEEIEFLNKERRELERWYNVKSNEEDS